MPHKRRASIDWQQAQERKNQNKLDPELDQQIFCMMRTTNAQGQMGMLYRSHKNRSIVTSGHKEAFNFCLKRVSQDLSILKNMIRSSIKES